jgi:hypothetical protein
MAIACLAGARTVLTFAKMIDASPVDSPAWVDGALPSWHQAGSFRRSFCQACPSVQVAATVRNLVIEWGMPPFER